MEFTFGLRHAELGADVVDGFGVDDGRLFVIWVGKQIKREILLKPGVPDDVFDGGAFHWVHLEHVDKQRHNAIIQVIGDGEDSGLDLGEESLHVFVVEGERAAEQGVEDDAGGPDVHLRSGVQLEVNFMIRGTMLKISNTN
jgi:hypothetical protein